MAVREHAVAPAEAEFEAAFEAVLDRLVEEELDALRVQDLVAQPPTFEEIFAFYRAAGFLYPAKFAELGERLGAIEATWTRLLSAGDAVFKLFTRRRAVAGEATIRNSVCAVEHAPGTWQCQHLVSADRHEYLGTLSAFLGMAEWLERNPAAAYTRLAYRPGNRGVAGLIAEWQRTMPRGDAALTTFDYIATPVEAVGACERSEDSAVRIVRAERGDAEALRRLYASSISPVEMDSLRLDDPSLRVLEEEYGRLGLERRRRVFMAVAGESVVGAAICNVGPPGANLSFLESAIENVEVDPAAPHPLREAALRELLAAAARFYRAHGRTALIAMIDSQNAELAGSLGLVARNPKQYTVFTGRNSPEGFAATRRCFHRYYRALVLLDASRDRPAS
jgi:hypothetical protein